MYKNIGKKIRGLAAVIGWIGMILYVLVGIVMCIAMMADEEVGLGIVCLLGGILGAVIWWIGTWMMYGFGELIVKTSEVADNTRNTAPTYGGYPPVNGRAANAYGAPAFVPQQAQARPQAQPQPQSRPQSAYQPAPQPQAVPQPVAQEQCEFCKQPAQLKQVKVPGLAREYKLCPQCIRQHNASAE